MKNLRNPTIAFVIFGILVSLCILVFNGFESNYNLTETGTQNVNISGIEQNGNIMEQLQRLNLVEGMNEIGVSIEKIGTPSASLTDILGALAGVAIGVIKTITGIVTLPVSIGLIIASFYQIPPIIYVGIGVIFFVFIGFILISAYLRSEI